MESKTLSKLFDNLEFEDGSEISVISEEDETYKGVVTWSVSKSSIQTCLDSGIGRSVCSPSFSVGSAAYCNFSLSLFPGGRDELTKQQLSIVVKFGQLPAGARIEGDVCIVGKCDNILKSDISAVEGSEIIIEFLEKSVNLKRYYSGDALVVQSSIKIMVNSVQSVSDNQNFCIKKSGTFDSFKQSLLESNKFSDVSLCAHGGVVEAHKAILAFDVPVFRVVFNSVLSSEMEFKLRDIDAGTLKHLLHFVYIQDVPKLNFKLACKLYVGGNIYKIFNLQKLCSSYLGANLTEKNVFIVLNLAHEHKDIYLKEFCIEFIKKCDSQSLSKISVLPVI